jgi:cytoskeletal protein RodZ
LGLLYIIANSEPNPLQNLDMPTVGEQLRGAREARKLDIYQVAEVTKIRTDHLRALEEGNYDIFTATVYIRGFVRTYATLLKLEVPKVMAALDEELSHSEKFRSATAHPKSSRGPLDWLILFLSRLNWRILGIAGAMIALVIISLATFTPRRKTPSADPLINLSPGLYQPKQGGELLPLPTNAPRR